jgi:hypothetical protein
MGRQDRDYAPTSFAAHVRRVRAETVVRKATYRDAGGSTSAGGLTKGRVFADGGRMEQFSVMTTPGRGRRLPVVGARVTVEVTVALAILASHPPGYVGTRVEPRQTRHAA